ncbi:MAG: type II toxin-antitoxin system VapC family toxin [Acidobacteria bacterium]|nr:type II toxin-antitoxin system VapC family toxin [Acidobacteriota bacterium]
MLDSDIYTLYFTRESPQPILEGHILGTDPSLIWISVVTAEESIRGAFKLIKDTQNTARVTLGYQFLSKTLYALKKYQILPFDAASYERFQRIPIEVRRDIKTRDSRIAASALSRDFKVVTRNLKHFRLVPGLECVDWTQPDP